MPNFFRAIKDSISGKIDYNIAIRTGEITADNGDGTYDVKISQSDQSYPDVETMYYGDIFSVGEVVDIGFEYGCKESPKIMGHSKKIAQEPKEVEVDYSGSTGGGAGGLQTITTDPIYSNANDGAISNTSTGYSLCRTATVGNTVASTGDSIPIGYFNDTIAGGDEYAISRGFIFFDTSDIPSNANIISAILSLYKDTGNSFIDTEFDLVVQDGQPDYPHSTLVAGDYNQDYYHNNGGSINTANISDSAYSVITLNSNGRNWIKKGGITKLCLRDSLEISGTNSSTGLGYYEILGIYCEEKGTGYKPKLVITYTI